MQTPQLETERLILRPLALSDAPAIQRHFDNWNIIRHLSTVVPGRIQPMAQKLSSSCSSTRSQPERRFISGCWC
jgi:hypothetical protein